MLLINYKWTYLNLAKLFKRKKYGVSHSLTCGFYYIDKKFSDWFVSNNTKSKIYSMGRHATSS